MQYRGFIHFTLLLLASGCLVFGLAATLTVLMIFALVVELTVWTRVLEPQQTPLE